MSTNAAHRSIAVLKYPKSVLALIPYALAIVKAMTNNANFVKPAPALVDVTGAINDLQAAQTATESRTHGTVVVRNQKKIALVAILELLRSYVQGIADADPEQSSGIIESAGMIVRKVPVRLKRTFVAKPGPVTGSVVLSAPSAGHRSSYDWQVSTDGGKTWQMLTTSLQVKTTAKGLQPGSTAEFRYRAVTKAGPGDWSAPIAVIVN